MNIYAGVVNILCSFWKMSINVTGSPTNLTTLAAGSPPLDEGFDPVKAEAGAIVGVVFGILVSAGFIAVAGVLYIRKKRERDREYMRNAKVQRVSAESAGVYRDTTTESQFKSPTHNPLNKGSEYTALRKNRDIYEDDSDEEL